MSDVKIQKRSGGRLTEAYILSQYPHVIEGTMRWNDIAGKQQVTIRCTAEGCDETRDVFTSDLFQVRMCETHAKEARKAAKAAKKAAAKAEAPAVTV
jgi:hypothetical protein